MSDPNWHPEDARIVDDRSGSGTILKYLAYAVCIVSAAYVAVVVGIPLGWFA